MQRTLSRRALMALACAVASLAAWASEADSVSSQERVTFEEVARVELKHARAVVPMNGGVALVCQNLQGAALVDFSRAAAPKILRRFSTEEMQPIHAVWQSDRAQLVVADRFRGVVVWDAASPVNARERGRVAVPGIANHVTLQTAGARTLAHVACGGEGLTTVDITQPTSPTILHHTTATVDFTRRSVMSRLGLWTADNYDGGAKLYDVSDASNPKPRLAILLPGFAESVQVHDDDFIVSYRERGFEWIRLDPSAHGNDLAATPSLVRQSTVYRGDNRLFDAQPLSGGRLLASAGGGGAILYQLENEDVASGQPPRPVARGRFQADSLVMHCQPMGEYLAVSAWEAGVIVVQARTQNGKIVRWD